MRVFKLRDLKAGFSFIEVIIALTIIGIMITSMFTLKINVFRKVVKHSSRQSCIMALENMFIDARLEEGLTKNKNETVQYSVLPLTVSLERRMNAISEKSSLKDFKDILVESVKGTWSDFGTESSESLLTFVYKFYVKKDENKSK